MLPATNSDVAKEAPRTTALEVDLVSAKIPDCAEAVDRGAELIDAAEKDGDTDVRAIEGK